MTNRVSFTMIICTACVALLADSLSAQEPSSRPAAAPNTPIGLPGGAPSTAGGVIVYPYGEPSGPGAAYPGQPGGYAVRENNGPRARLGQELGRLMTILSSNPDEEERGKATEAARKAIAEYFDLDMQGRRQELDQVMQRATGMEETLTRREAAKEDLVDLQMKSLELEANGLGLVPTVRSVSESATSQGPDYSAAYSDLYGTYAAEDAPEDPRSSTRSALLAAYKGYREATSTEDRDEARAALRQALADYFDVDMKVRRAELDEIQTGLERLKEAIEKRADARDEIIQVQLQLILNQASGLGFFGDSQINERVVVPNYAPAQN